jgi:TRAP-type C4-dicarboxylate transport system permease small subunit
MSEAETSALADSRRPPLVALARLSFVMALLGGLLAFALALIVVASVLGRWLFATPINGDFEFVKMGTAIAVFCFLPYCQSLRGNIVVDTFTAQMPQRVNAAIDAFWDLVYAAMMGLLAVCLFNGTVDFYRSGEPTMMLQFVVWPAIAACTLLAALLACVALATAVHRLRGRAA